MPCPILCTLQELTHLNNTTVLEIDTIIILILEIYFYRVPYFKDKETETQIDYVTCQCFMSS